MTPRSNDELGHAAYGAYARFVGNKTVHGDDMWTWEELPPHIAQAWMCAAVTVKGLIALEERALREKETSE